MTRDFVGAAAAVLCYAVYVCGVAVFCRRHLRASWFCGQIFGLFFFLGGVLCDCAGRRGAVPNIVATLSYHMLSFVLTLIFFRERTEKKVFTAAVLIAVTTFAENFCVSLFSCLELFYLHEGKRMIDPVLGEWESWCIVCASLMLTTLGIFSFSGYFSTVLCGKTKRWYLTLTIPLLAAVLVVDVANWGAAGGVMVRSGGSMGLYCDQLFSYAGTCVLTALSMSAVGFYVFGMNRIYTEQEKSAQCHMQIAAYRVLEEQYRQSERLRHDLKNHVLALSGFLEKKEWDGMARYLNDMRDSVDFGSGEEITGNRTADILLYQKRKTAESKNILWECDAQMPPQCHIREFDLCVLLGNLLDNAIEACGRLRRAEDNIRFIRIRIGTVRRCLLLEIENSMTDKRKEDAAAGQNTGKESHGIGLANVRDVVRRYDGTMNIESGEGIFTVSLLLPFPDGGAAHTAEQTV